MRELSELSKLHRWDDEEKSLTAYLLELTLLMAKEQYRAIATLIAEITQSDAVLLRLADTYFSTATLSQADQDFLENDIPLKLGQNRRLGSVLRGERIVLGRAEIQAFSKHDRKILDQIEEHLNEDWLRGERYRLLTRDPQTGFWGREICFDFLEQEFIRSRRYQAPLSIIFIDIDGFSRFSNPDAVLTKTAQRIKAEIRQGNLMARLANNTFVLIEAMANSSQTQETAMRLLKKFKHLPVLVQEVPLNIHLSMGIASLSNQDESFTSLLEHADRALSAAKRLGGNQIVVYDLKR